MKIKEGSSHIREFVMDESVVILGGLGHFILEDKVESELRDKLLHANPSIRGFAFEALACFRLFQLHYKHLVIPWARKLTLFKKVEHPQDLEKNLKDRDWIFMSPPNLMGPDIMYRSQAEDGTFFFFCFVKRN